MVHDSFYTVESRNFLFRPSFETLIFIEAQLIFVNYRDVGVGDNCDVSVDNIDELFLSPTFNNSMNLLLGYTI